MEFMWNIVFYLIPVVVFVLIPFMTFYYEADDGMLMAGTAYAPNAVKKSRLASACCYQMFVFIIVGIIFAVTYIALGDTKVPVEEFIGGTIAEAEGDSQIGIYNFPTQPFNATFLESMNNNDVTYLAATAISGDSPIDIVLQVSVGTFYAGLMSWAGWFLFALFGGIGMAALPLDLIMSYVNRPRHMDAIEFAEAQLSLRERTNELVDIGELIKIEREQKAAAGLTIGTWSAFSLDSDTRKGARDEKQAILGFKQAVYLLEQDVEDFLAMSKNYEKYNPLMPYIYFVLGICSSIISLFWLLHIIIYVIPSKPLALFLNTYFLWFDKFFPLFGVLSVALFTVYLLFSAVKGCFKFGVRFMFFQIHPMKVGKTYMSSFMFNVGLVLLCALPVVQFAQQAFADYAANSTIRQIMGVQVENLQFFSWFFRSNLFIYLFMGMSVLTGLYLACRPRDQSANGQALRDRLRSRTG
jgi:LMBR1 domain-containing protein 1